MTAMDDLVTWLRAQLDNDERMARAADVKQGDPDWRVSPVVITRGEHFTVRSVRDARPIARVQRLDGDEGEPAAILDGAAVAEHIANWDPARVLAEVAAKRRVIEWLHPVDRTGMASILLRTLALPYADCPGYRDEWRL